MFIFSLTVSEIKQGFLDFMSLLYHIILHFKSRGKQGFTITQLQ